MKHITPEELLAWIKSKVRTDVGRSGEKGQYLDITQKDRDWLNERGYCAVCVEELIADGYTPAYIVKDPPYLGEPEEGVWCGDRHADVATCSCCGEEIELAGNYDDSPDDFSDADRWS